MHHLGGNENDTQAMREIYMYSNEVYSGILHIGLKIWGKIHTWTERL